MLSTGCLDRKFHDHQQRAVDMGECLPPWEWIDDDGTPQGYIFWSEVLDGLATLIAFCNSTTS